MNGTLYFRATDGSLNVSSLSTLQAKVGKKFTIKDKNGGTEAITYTLTLYMSVTNILQMQRFL